MNQAFIDKQIQDRMQSLFNQKMNPLVEQLNAELSRMKLAQENAEKIKKEIAKQRDELFATANQLAEAYQGAAVEPKK